MAEWSNAAVLKTVDLFPRIRGFESLFLRIPNRSRSPLRDFYFQQAVKCLHLYSLLKIKTDMSSAHVGAIWDAWIPPTGSPTNEVRRKSRTGLQPNGITDSRSEEVIPPT